MPEQRSPHPADGDALGNVETAWQHPVEEALRHSERLLRLVLRTLPVGVVVLDRAGGVLLDNPSSSRIWGRVIASGPERYARSTGAWHDSGKPITPDEWASARALRDGEASLGELVDIVTFDGQRKTMLNSAAPIRDETGTIIGAVVVNEDVTERVRTEEALRQTQHVLLEAERLGRTGSWEWDLATGEILATEGNRRLFFGDGAGKGSRIEDYVAVYHPEDRERMLRTVERNLEETAVEQSEFRIILPDGSLRWILGRVQIHREKDGKRLRAHGTNTDITERKGAEEVLARQARQQSAIAQLSLSALRGDALQPIFDEAVALVAATLNLDHAMVVEPLPDQSGLKFRAAAGPWKTELIGSVPIRMAPGFMSWFSLRASAPVVVADLPAETRFIPCEVFLAHGIKSGINVPIPGKDRPFGVLGAHSTVARTFSEDESNFVWSVASVLATCIERRRVASELGLKREQLQVLSRKLIEAQEAERRAVARELHDDFGQVLTAIKINLQRRHGNQAESIELVDGAIARMRDLAQDLRPPLLDELGLDASLAWYVKREAERAGLLFELKVATLPARPPPAVETTCFRIAQEALTNVIRHAQAARVEVELSAGGDRLELAVRDDGKGFDVAAARKRAAQGGSQGILGMQERVSLADGELEIDSAPGRGSTVRARLPLGKGAHP